jgi:hypothetical protein
MWVARDRIDLTDRIGRYIEPGEVFDAEQLLSPESLALLHELGFIQPFEIRSDWEENENGAAESAGDQS